MPRSSPTHATGEHISRRQIRQIADSIKQFGFTAPVLVDEGGVLLAGHGRWKAAGELGLKEIPAIALAGLSEAQKRALLIADNKIAANAGWDRERLAIELPVQEIAARGERDDVEAPRRRCAFGEQEVGEEGCCAGWKDGAETGVQAP